MRKQQIFCGAIILLLITSCQFGGKSKTATEQQKPTYKTDWDSLAKYQEAPEWFKKAKFGIYAHWGVLSVPAFANDWYPRNMHVVGSYEYKHHVVTYGEPKDFGYHDFVPMFKAEKFNADEWAELFQKAGAKFGGVVAEHHDGWSNWKSKINPWNAYDKGPHRDILGELEKAIHSREMKFVASFHKARNLQIYQKDTANWLNDTSYFPYNPNMPTSSNDAVISMMYGNIPKEQFYKNWLGELKEVIDNYSPDLIYFDSKLDKIPEEYKKEFVAYYLNHAAKNNQGVVMTHKEGELPKSVSLEDFEKGRMNKITKDYWLTDETVSVGSWSYTNDLGLKKADEIIHVLADVVSKNGALMLNVSPMANGVIPENQQKILLEIGDWLKINGEAIYETSTWKVFGEGPTKQEKSGMFLDKITYTNKDIRYTKKDNNIYAIVLGWPGNNMEINLSSFANETNILKVELLGSQESIVYHLEQDGLHVITPSQRIDDKAIVFKIFTE
ncbi:alpha-L-fucosidase [Wenyingzhuangia sp. chi5]|uniref:alpha-L-fucosidase n=1 Tax=Wenyingzhuangia gilva TaxID=3057677 RepID=A0ABT8VTQ0_9FLAO|nr:alpha-L-fucosidase [Wenyingzhuangia sp. chi5]MDO3695358.1 alpha-L-fucosidase [Wenyingzhuangia sp. chi5]